MLKIKNLLIICVLIAFQLFFIRALAIEDVEVQAPAMVADVTFQTILDKAKEHAYDLKIADFNTLIAKTGVKAARSEYFPKFSAMAGTEYTKNFRDSNETTVMSIGEAFINPYTRFQSVMGIMLNYNLFDFGVRRSMLNAAKEDVDIKELEEQEKWQEIQLTLVDNYSKIIMLQKQIDINTEMLAIEEQTLEFVQRLLDAKEISVTELNDQVVKVETVKNRISDLKATLNETIEWLSFFTGEVYDIKNLSAQEIEKPDYDVTAFHDYTKSLTWQIREKYIKKKEFELKAAQRMNYPKVNVYSKYYWYGSDHDSYSESFKDIGPSNFSVGGYVNWMLFDGMKNRANIQKTSLELQQLHVERDKAVAELTTRLAVMRSNLIFLEEQIAGNEKMISELKTKEKSIKRLLNKKLVTPLDENRVKMEILQQQIELAKNTTSSVAIVKSMEILTKY